MQPVSDSLVAKEERPSMESVEVTAILKSGSRRGRPLPDIDLRKTWQIVVGAVLVAVGPILILLAYAGTARTPFVSEQIPYVLSGGLLGLALTIVGGFFFWGHWLYRQYERNEHHQGEVLRVLEGLREDVRTLAGATPASDVIGTEPSDDDVLVVTRRGSMVHRASCPVVVDKPGLSIVAPDEVTLGGRSPCGVCRPPLPAPTTKRRSANGAQH